MAKTPRTPAIFDEATAPTRAQKLTMGLPPKKETTNGKAADPEPPAADPGDQPAQADGDGDAD